MDRFINAAIEILKEVWRPLHSNTITQEAIKKWILKTIWKTPQESMSSRISTDIKINWKNSFFIRTKPWFYNLNQNRKKKITSKKAENQYVKYTDDELKLIFSLPPTEDSIKKLAKVFKREEGWIRQQYQRALLTWEAIKRKGRDPEKSRCRKIAKEMWRIRTS